MFKGILFILALVFIMDLAPALLARSPDYAFLVFFIGTAVWMYRMYHGLDSERY